jgi:hypothetical protein
MKATKSECIIDESAAQIERTEITSRGHPSLSHCFLFFIIIFICVSQSVECRSESFLGAFSQHGSVGTVLPPPLLVGSAVV